ncbi:MAG: putative toxin-antitoxin system toxin component, PIN family [Spirochaetaceae bacterium]|nr:MAG: putative toxin-antitoxin system toxin component, PIN family [Spirochaetaceae bacterium]
MRQIVLDTNVLVSGLMSASNPPGRIIDGVRANELQLCIDDRIFGEYDDVLNRPELRRWIHREDSAAILDHIRNSAYRVDSAVTITGLPDPDDAPFAEVAAASNTPLVTGNVRHFPAKIVGSVVVLTPRLFLTSI